MKIADKEIAALLRRLRTTIVENGHSLRGLTARTRDLDIPERIYHSTLSKILSGTPGYNLYVQHLLVLLRLMRVSPAAFFVGPVAADVADALDRLPDAARADVLAVIADRLSQAPRSTRLAGRLRAAARQRPD